MRLRRILALRAMVASGQSQREIASSLGISQPAVSQQLRSSRELSKADPQTLLEAARPILRSLSIENGYSRLAVFGSLARGEGREDSDFDFLVEAPTGTSSFDFLQFEKLLERVLGREVDLVSYGGLKSGSDDDILRESILL